MKDFKIGTKFYVYAVLLCLILAIPISKFISNLLIKLDIDFLNELNKFGLINPPTTLFIILGIITLYTEYLWKLPLFNLIHSVPNINGRYKGIIESSYNKDQKYHCYLEVSQTLTKINISLFTERSSSHSRTCSIVINNHNNWEIIYSYLNRPTTVNVDADMKTHSGLCCLEIFNKNLKGTYFNNPRDRASFGSMEFEFIGSKRFGKFKV